MHKLYDEGGVNVQFNVEKERMKIEMKIIVIKLSTHF